MEQNQTVSEQLLSEKEVARMLGVTPFYVRERRVAGEIPSVRLSWRTVRYRRSDVEAFITAHMTMIKKAA